MSETTWENLPYIFYLSEFVLFNILLIILETYLKIQFEESTEF